MKRQLSTLALSFLFSFLAFQVTAQKSIREGKLIYEISYPDMELDANMAAMLPVESIVYFNEDFSRTETAMGMGMSSASIVNSKTGGVTTLMDMMGTKSAIVMTDEQIKDARKKSETSGLKVEVTNETKEIAGYECKKAILKDETSNTSFEVYFTDKINSYAQMSTEWKELKGCPMQFTVEQGGMKFQMIAKSVSSEPVAADLFKIPSDYKIVTQEEMMKMLGAGSKD